MVNSVKFKRTKSTKGFAVKPNINPVPKLSITKNNVNNNMPIKFPYFREGISRFFSDINKINISKLAPKKNPKIAIRSNFNPKKIPTAIAEKTPAQITIGIKCSKIESGKENKPNTKNKQNPISIYRVIFDAFLLIFFFIFLIKAN
ncbi:hypothetical protein H1P_6800002 [Hyella patelloides LEGE 07179]|uniref:Uncharacterized protein n=1 Tax=Hyella patelloides LEGE 07179 TaxID=945734 RepID=A0A563W2Z8_9CYAN|nr:hypothetical protein H1P_6800002 [Hyella patelloides LEGE 07179]